MIENKIEDGYQNKKLVVAASTDLSAAYDTVNHKILLKKLEYYGVSGTELKLFKSYLSNRKQYADINTKKSEMIDCLDCGVIQGSKLSGLLYTIYTNDVPILHEILENEEVCNTIGAKHYNKLPVNHDVVNFVDDSNSVITADPGVDIEDYTKNYFKLLEIYYNSQKLKIKLIKLN